MAEKKYFTDAEKKAGNVKRVREFQARNDQMTIVFPAGTKKRMFALELGKSNTAFVRDAVLNELSRLEKEKKKRDKEAGAE